MRWKSWRSMNPLDQYMMFVAVFGKTFLIIQIVKIFLDGSSENVSFTAYLLYFLTSISWVAFGVYYEETVVTTSSMIGTLGGLLAMNVIMAYKENKDDLF